MNHFTVKCGKEIINVEFCISLLSVRYRGKGYLINHCPEEGWQLKVGKLRPETLQKICDAIENHVVSVQPNE